MSSKQILAILLQFCMYVIVFVLLAMLSIYVLNIPLNLTARLIILVITYLLVPRLQVLKLQSGEQIKPVWLLSKFLSNKKG